VTIRFSVLLMILGVVFFILTGSGHPTALIPVWFGLALLGLGILARSDNEKRRMAIMHVAVLVALIGCVFPLARVAMHGLVLSSPAVKEELAMGIICGVLTFLYVQSFIAVRKARKA